MTTEELAFRLFPAEVLSELKRIAQTGKNPQEPE